jgi:DNA-binding response OmpR family regulator
MLSARGRAAEVDKGLALGADAYVTKPFAIQELLAEVARQLPGAGA